MRIALPLNGGRFSQHFGQSTAFWICDVPQGSGAALEGREIGLAEGGGCGMIPAALAQAGVNLVIAGGMGAGAVRNLARCGIQVIAGVSGGTPQEIVRNYLTGKLAASGELCQHHLGNHEGDCHGHGRE